ncbi:Cytochrome c oxidase subunit 6B [Hibiscus syriacus]|uniref:Cytochrome c oxidase subunit 6B n=1 Tax=Hibiscus syriacus TaxID=106335 RepID=A0A6A3CJX5_HIBSY|nr:cytochrome c oxidase subunit 6b-1-like [Hibiscus syriacus]KAE8727872.1 Cytochrome c oxidase subunit 6B [Hibiscus syriacus]
MADAQTENTLSLSEQYALEKEEKPDVAPKPADTKEIENPENVASGSGNVVTEKLEEAPAATVEGSIETPPPAAGDNGEGSAADSEEGSEPAAQENSDDAEETSEIKLETAPADFRFPTTNQTRHCFTRYIEYHRCVAAKGEDAPDCDKFAKYYRALCPGEWIDRWNEQRENGTFPGPL